MQQSSVAAVAQLDGTIQNFRSSIDSSMQQVEQTTSQIQQTANEIYDRVSDFKEKMVTSEEVQLAQENIIRIDQVIKEQFGDYDRIRRTIIGVVRDFDINLVRNKTMGELSEELWLTSSRYWLSYALIAVTAWVNNYPEVAANALSECSRRDGIKASLFFTLLNLRFGRNDTARRWFANYLRTLDPDCMQQEASVMLQAYLAGIFGTDKALEAKVNATIDEWISVISEEAAVCEELVQAYTNYIANLQPSVPFTLTALRAFCQNVAQVESTVGNVSKYATVKALLDSLDVQQVDQRPDNYKARIDTVLTQLISEYDHEEDELKQQQQYYNLVISNGGHVQDAENQFQEMLRLKGEGYNVGKQFVGWVLYANEGDVDVHVRKFALGRTKDWFSQALTGFANAVAQQTPTSYRLAIDGWSGSTDGSDEAARSQEMQEWFAARKPAEVFLNLANIIAFILAVVCGGLAFLNPLTLIGTGVGLAFIGIHIWLKLRAWPKRVQTALANLHACYQQIGMVRTFIDQAQRTRTLIEEQLEYDF